MMKPQTNRYILCRYIPTLQGKYKKVPLNSLTLDPHNPLDSSIHLNYDDARNRAESLGEGYGVGFVIMKDEGYFFIDLDNCLTNENTWSETAINTLQYYPQAYIEVSHSGRGLHIIGRYEGTAPFDGKRLDAIGVEIYTAGRFCALTGTQAQGNAETVHTERLTQYIDALGINTKPTANSDWTTEDEPGSNVPQDNNELMTFVLNRRLSKNEAFGGTLSIRDLWENNNEVLAKHFPTQTPGNDYDASAADAALAYRLHYFAGRNCERVLELMNLSKLKRVKWEQSSNYLPRTIVNARGVKLDFFTHARLPQTPDYTSKSNAVAQQGVNNRMLQAMNYPEVSPRGKVLDTAVNLKLLLDIFSISTRWDNMKREREIIIPKCELFAEDQENFSLNIIKDLALNNEMPIMRIDDHLNYLAQRDSFHPIVEGLAANPWDGVPRLDKFIDTLETTNQPLSQKLVRRWMISAIAAAHAEKGFESHGVLVLAGDQNLGKTRFIKALDPFNCDAVKSGALLDPKDKDCVKTLASFWIAELGELDGTFRKSDMARLKSFITESFDKLRFPYARKDSTLYRRTVYAATVNDPNYLVDETGNRRWWTIHVLSINEKHGLDMAQVWAEVFAIWNAGEQTWMTPQEFSELSEHNKNHEQNNPLEELLHTFFDFSEGWDSREMVGYSATEVLRVLGVTNPNRYQATQMGKILAKVTGKLPQRTKTRRLHHLVPVTNINNHRPIVNP